MERNYTVSIRAHVGPARAAPRPGLVESPHLPRRPAVRESGEPAQAETGPMFRKPAARPLQLQIGERTLALATPRDLDFALAGRSGPSSGRAGSLMGLSDAALAHEAEQLADMQQRLEQAVAAGADGRAGRWLRELDLSLVTEDNDWRRLLAALHALDDRHEEYKRVALAKYLEYVASGRELVRRIRAGRQRPAPGEAPAPAAAGPVPVRQRLDFDPGPAAGEDGTLRRLPKGERVEVRFEPHQSLALALSRHRFVLVSGEPWLLVDDTGADARLDPGRNLVGRSVQCEATVSPGYGDVSRKHLIVEIAPAGAVGLTDISTLGTWAALDLPEPLLH